MLLKFHMILMMGMAFLTATQAFSQNVSVSRDALLGEKDEDFDANRILRESVAESDLDYYGLEETSKRMFRASARVDGTYDSNIFISDGGETDDFIWTLAPSLIFEPLHLENNSPHYFKAVYNPEFKFFTDNPSENSIEQSGYASYLYKGERLTFNAKHQGSSETGPSRDIGQRIELDNQRTQFVANIDLFEKWSTLWVAEQDLSFYENQNNQHTWTGQGYLLYKPHQKLTMGIGSKFGWTDIEGSPNQDFQQALLKLSWVPHPDWEFDFTGGVEVRSFQDSAGVGTRATPVFQGLASYRIFPQTRIRLSGYRHVRTSSGLLGNNYEATGTRLGVEYAFLRDFSYNGGFGFEHSNYYNTSTNIPTFDRDDFFYYTNHSLAYQLNEFVSFDVHYQYMTNDSNRADFNRHRVGISTTFTY